MNQVLTHTLDRTVLIRADRDLVFSFFTESDRWATWWGAGSSIEPRTGGHVFIRFPDGTEVSGEVVEVVVPERVVFTYGFVSGTPIAAGASLVTIELDEELTGTRVRLSHAFADPDVRDHHVQGWRYQLSLFANAVARRAHAGADAIVDRWFAAWSNPDADTRRTALEQTVAPSVAMRDRFSAVEGLPDLIEHLTAVHKFMPGLTIARDGTVRQCQGMAIADWVVRDAAGQERSRGTNVFTLTPDGRIESVTGFWG
jgi:uncharacterized protein YndB with AHSA1/START domain